MWRPFVPLMIVIAAVVVAALPAPAAAATFVVTRPDDPAPDGCNSGVDCSLREAIIDANATPEEDTITVPAGTYTLTIAGTAEQAAATGDLDTTTPIIINGAGAATTIIQAGLDTTSGIDRVFDVRAGSLSISGLTIRHGNAGPVGGGGISVSSGAALTVSASVITDSTLALLG